MTALDDGWWECSHCGAMSMHWIDEYGGDCECVNCDVKLLLQGRLPFWRPPWWTIFWCCLIGAAIWTGLGWWIFI